jgi:hypothetical protein
MKTNEWANRWPPSPEELPSGVGSGLRWLLAWVLPLAGLLLSLWLLDAAPAWADGVRLPGEDASSKMESAGTLLRFVDTGLFRWVARLLAGLCILAAGWNLKEMRFAPAFISVIAAILFGTAPTWVKNIFTIGGADSVFGYRLERETGNARVVATTAPGRENHDVRLHRA